MAKALPILTAFLYLSLTFSLGLIQAQSRSSPPRITVYEESG